MTFIEAAIKAAAERPKEKPRTPPPAKPMSEQDKFLRAVGKRRRTPKTDEVLGYSAKNDDTKGVYGPNPGRTPAAR